MAFKYILFTRRLLPFNRLEFDFELIVALAHEDVDFAHDFYFFGFLFYNVIESFSMLTNTVYHSFAFARFILTFSLLNKPAVYLSYSSNRYSIRLDSFGKGCER